MGIDAKLRSSVTGEVAQIVGDAQSDFSASLRGAELQNTVCLRFIDPFGYTTFNGAQCKVLEVELSDLRNRLRGKPAEHIDRLLKLVELAIRKRGYELHFVGD